MEAEKRVREDRFGGYVRKRLDEALDEIAWLGVLDNGTRRPPWIDINLCPGRSLFARKNGMKDAQRCLIIAMKFLIPCLYIYPRISYLVSLDERCERRRSLFDLSSLLKCRSIKR